TFVQEAFSIAGEKLQKHDPGFEKEMAVYESPLQFSARVRYAPKLPPRFNITLLYNLGRADNFIPEEQTITVVLDSVAAEKVSASQRMVIETIQLESPVADCRAGSSKALGEDNSGLGGIFLLGFFGGLLALL